MKDRIKLIRQYFGMTQYTFGRCIMLSVSRVNDLESGKLITSIPTFSLICRAFNINPDWLLVGRGDMFSIPISEVRPPEIPDIVITSQDEIIERIMQIRRYLGYSTNVFAKVIGFRSSAVSSRENRLIPVTPRYVYAILLSFGVSKDWLLFGNGEMKFDKTWWGAPPLPTFGADTNIYNRLASVQSDLGISSYVFSKAIGLGRHNYYNVLCGALPLTENIVNKVCSVFGVNEQWLRVGDGEEFTDPESCKLRCSPPKRKEPDLSKTSGRVAAVRLHFCISRPNFAKILGITASMLSYIESGKSNLVEKHIRTICEHFHVNETWLRTGEGEMLDRDLL